MLPKDHPLVHQKFILPTNAIEELLNTIVQWLDHKVPGGLVYGIPRAGKTSAIDFLRGRLNDVLDDPLPIMSIEGSEERTNATPKAYWSGFLEDIGSAWADSGTAADCRRSVIQTLHARCIAYRSPRLLLFVDDAQWYSTSDYAKLVDLRKQLRRRQIELIAISVGQEELELKRGSMSGTSRWPVIGRFMQESVRYEGSDLEDDLERILGAYDDDTEYPVGSGVSYTQAALRKAWRAGFRLRSLRPGLAKVIAKRRMELTGGIDTDEYPIPPLLNTVNGLLRELTEQDAADLAPSEATLAHCVKHYAGALLAAQIDDQQ